jgi:phosphoserine phosphatase RsbU/P
LSLLLEATSLVQSRLPLEQVLAAVVDRAIELTGSHRGLLFQALENDELVPVFARKRGARALPPHMIYFTQFTKDYIGSALKKRRIIMEARPEEDAQQAGYADKGRGREGLVCICVPLVMPARLSDDWASEESGAGTLMGLLYLDGPYSEHGVLSAIAAFVNPAADPLQFQQRRQILGTLAVQSAGALSSARLMQRELERERMKQELAIAHGIQQALLPKSFKELAHLQVTGINRPSLSVGGDYFDLIELGPERTAFVIADVSGKGLGAALVTSMLQGTFSAIILRPELPAIFEHANRFICEHAEVERYSTLFFGVLTADGELQYVNAGHHPPILIRSGRVETDFKAESVPLGLFPDTIYPARCHKLKPGDTLILYTDGITEAMDAGHNEFGIERFRQAVTRHAGASVAELQTPILEALDEFARGAQQADDITLLILRYQTPTLQRAIPQPDGA